MKNLRAYEGYDDAIGADHLETGSYYYLQSGEAHLYNQQGNRTIGFSLRAHWKFRVVETKGNLIVIEIVDGGGNHYQWMDDLLSIKVIECDAEFRQA